MLYEIDVIDANVDTGGGKYAPNTNSPLRLEDPKEICCAFELDAETVADRRLGRQL